MGVSLGPLCALQGALKQTADIGIALWQMVIAGHTFCLLFLELKVRQFVLWVMMIGGWSFVGALVILGPATADETKRGPFYGIIGEWCLISPVYKVERITLDYLIMFLAAFISTVLYVLIFLRLRGKLHRRRSTTESPTSSSKSSQADAIAKQMVLYPLVYVIIILPTACAQFAIWAGVHVPVAATVFCSAIFHLSGVLNSTIFFIALRRMPAETMNLRLGRWTITSGGEFSHSNDTLEAGKQDRGNTQSRPTSMASNASTTTTIASKRSKPRPPDIIITRDSFESMYSVYDEVPVVADSQQQQRPSVNHWSPDGQRQRRYQ